MMSVSVEGRKVEPGKILCIGRNYIDHIAELGNELPEEMVVFSKPNAAISDHLLSKHGEPLHYESELCFMMEGGELKYIAFGFDLTKRALQSRLREKGLPWERSKAFDGSAVFSKFVGLRGEVATLRLEMRIDGKLVQTGSAGEMLYQPPQIVQELARFTTLNDGDIVMTGTPKGVGVIRAGARFEGIVFAGDRELVRGSWLAR